jgi:hypothetical protein
MHRLDQLFFAFLSLGGSGRVWRRRDGCARPGWLRTTGMVAHDRDGCALPTDLPATWRCRPRFRPAADPQPTVAEWSRPDAFP